MDLEYNALRRRMSRLRVEHKNRRVSDDMDADVEDIGYDDLIKFWKKHNISIAREMIPAANRHKARQKAKARGRRKSLEFEDLDVQTSTGNIKLPIGFTKSKELARTDSKDAIPEEPDTEETHQIPSIRRPRKTIPEQQHDFIAHRQKSRTVMGTKEKQIVNAKLETSKKPAVKRTDSDSGVKKRTGSEKGSKATRERKTSESSPKTTSTKK